MNPSLLLRVISLLAVVASGVFYFQIKGQKQVIEDNLTQSRAALQAKLEESASLKSRALNAEESSRQLTQQAKEEIAKAQVYKDQFNTLKQKLEEAETGRLRSESEVTNLSAANRELQREVINLRSSLPPQNWREQLNQLQSRLLDLEAENTSLKKSLKASGNSFPEIAGSTANALNRPANTTKPLGTVIRIGPDGSFVIISYGRQLGAAEGQTLVIKRDQLKVGLVSLTQITNDFSIAQILSSTNTGNNLSVPDIQIGDSAYLE